MSELDEETLFAQSMEKIHAGPDAEVKEEVKPEGAEVAKPVESDTFDLTTLPPSVKSKWDALQTELANERRRAQEFEGKYAKIHGQVSPLQRELNRLKMQPATAKAAPAKAEQPVTKENLAHWMKHAKDYPEEAAAIEELLKDRIRDELGRFQPIPEDIAALRKELAELKEQQLQPLLEARENEVIAKAQNSVLEAHSDWMDHIRIEDDNGKVVITHVSEALQNWMDGQPDRIVAMFGSDDPRECIWVMNQFKRDTKPVSAEPAQVTDEKVLNASRELENRKKNLAALVAPKAEGAPRVDAGNLDEEELFEARMKELHRKRK